MRWAINHYPIYTHGLRHLRVVNTIKFPADRFLLAKALAVHHHAHGGALVFATAWLLFLTLRRLPARQDDVAAPVAEAVREKVTLA